MAASTWQRALEHLMLTRGRPRMDASDRFLVSQLQAARADDRLQRAAKYLPSKSFERAERRLTRAGASLDTSEWFYFRSPEATGQVLAEAEGWVLWRPDTGKQLTFVPVTPPESAPATARTEQARRARVATRTSPLPPRLG